ncbi:hypothetical protein U0070_003094, partial [Myodes glareolus]
AELSRAEPRGTEARVVAVRSRGGRTRPTRHQAEPEMLARAERPRPGPRPPLISPFSVPPPSLLLLLLVMLSAPVWGRVPRSVPRTSLPISEADSYLTRFAAPRTYNYSALLVDPASHTLYVGARDSIFALPLPFSGERPRRIDWMVPEAHRQNCRKKGKKEDECHNFIQILAIANASHLLTCGTFAFDPKCGVIDVSSFQQVERLESGRGKCPFEPAQRSAAVMAGEWGETRTGDSGPNDLLPHPCCLSFCVLSSLGMSTTFTSPLSLS